MTGVVTVEVNADEGGLRLDRWFKRRYPELPHGKLQKLTRSGQIRVDGKRVKAGDRIEPGQQVRVPPFGTPPPRTERPAPPKPAVSAEDAALIRSIVIYEDEATLAINKPPGLATQGGTGTTRHVDGLLTGMSSAKDRPRLVHRLDRDTSGVLLLGKTASSAAALAKAFRDRSARKIYWAIVAGLPSPPQGTIDMPLLKAGGNGNEKMIWDEDKGDRAVTDYAILERAGRFACIVALMPLTGRTHQIRAHMAAIGNPILGDGKYGGPDPLFFGGITTEAHMV
ncbi:MAG: RluA family pseudouridine synthase, partial [Alphaproteobacteria bacterium]